MYDLLTIGYTARTLSDLVAIVEHHHAVLVDTRYAPRSKVAHWNQGPLQRALGQRYVWMGSTLGNRNYANGGDIELAAPERAVAPVRDLLQQQPVILLCACMDVDVCHRRVAADYLAERIGCTVEHLPPPIRTRKAAPERTTWVVESPTPAPVVEQPPVGFTLTLEGKATRLLLPDGRTGLFVREADARREGERLTNLPTIGWRRAS